MAAGATHYQAAERYISYQIDSDVGEGCTPSPEEYADPKHWQLVGSIRRRGYGRTSIDAGVLIYLGTRDHCVVADHRVPPLFRFWMGGISRRAMNMRRARWPSIAWRSLILSSSLPHTTGKGQRTAETPFYINLFHYSVRTWQ